MPRCLSILRSWKTIHHDRKEGDWKGEQTLLDVGGEFVYWSWIWSARGTSKKKCSVGWGFLFREKGTCKIEAKVGVGTL